jgi:hypothetical protein
LRCGTITAGVDCWPFYQRFVRRAVQLGGAVFDVSRLLALVLAVYCLHQRYLHRAMPDGIPKFWRRRPSLLGVLLYSAIVRAEYPQIGSNFLPAIISVYCLGVLDWHDR